MPLQASARVACLIAIAAAGVAGVGVAQEPKKGEPEDVNDLSLEVNALETLHSLRLSDAQLQKLRALAKEAAPKAAKRTPATASKEYRSKLSALRTALIEQADDRIDELNEELDDLRDSEKPTIDDGVDLTPAARKSAPAGIKLLTVRQTKDYLDVIGDDLSDPLIELVNALDGLRGLTGKEWKEKRDDRVETIVRLATGVDAARADKLSDRITVLLATAHGLTDAEFKAQQAKLEDDARMLIGELDSLQVMRNALEYSMAELLSNPRLLPAIDARLKHD